MASATYSTVPAPVVVESVTLTLTPQEAADIKAIFGGIGGTAFGTIRVSTDAVYWAITDNLPHGAKLPTPTTSHGTYCSYFGKD